MRILLVEKHRSVASSHLDDDQFNIACAEDAGEALGLLEDDSYDLLLLNLAADPQDGFDLIRLMRAANDSTHILALTGGSVSDGVRALGLGADDTLGDPLDASVLRARLAAVMRRKDIASGSVLAFGELRLYRATQEVWVKETLVKLTAKEFMMLEHLVLRRGMVLTKPNFMDHLFGGELDRSDSKIIDVIMCKLRRKLERAGAGGLIEIVWNHGYIIRSPQRMLSEQRGWGLSSSRFSLAPHTRLSSCWPSAADELEPVQS